MNARLHIISSFIIASTMMIPSAFAKRADATLPDLVIRKLTYVQESPDVATFNFRIANVGRGTVKRWFAVAVFIDSKIYTHTIYNEQKGGTAAIDNDAVIPIKPNKFFEKSIGNYSWLQTGRHTVKICADRLIRGKSDSDPLFDDISNNVVQESNNENNCQSITLQDGKVE